MEAEKLFLLFSLLMLHFSSCTSLDSLKTNQTIKEGDLLISKGDIFALGFFSPGSSTNRYLGIWYHKIPEQTVVWVANRNDPIIGSSGFLFINQYGNLVLYGNDDQKLLVWSTNVSVEENDTCEAQLLDSGNLILVSKRSRKTVWQSFDYPTNTGLPGMKLGLDRKLGTDRFLTSWRSADDPGIGDFSIRINPNGSPQFFLYNGTKPITRAPPWPWSSQTGIFKTVFVNDPDEIYCESTVPELGAEGASLCHTSSPVSIGEGTGFFSGVNRYCFHSHAAGNKRKLIGSREKTMLAILALLLFLISLSSYLRLKKRAKKGTEPQVNSNSTESECFKLSTIMAATNNFSPANELGQGGFGSVYKLMDRRLQ
ncbi:G-type lectin S-receptor-like serine/threonine-protein kinase RKS1 isoform X3 [Populus alba]|uniref:G-type lectin S-receptor-like serine/threonine-protein kinase RKS1 isoform X3 n=1 Tax=Populus alba TaxID=43335 RepID=UPI003CC727B8